MRVEKSVKRDGSSSEVELLTDAFWFLSLPLLLTRFSLSYNDVRRERIDMATHFLGGETSTILLESMAAGSH